MDPAATTSLVLDQDLSNIEKKLKLLNIDKKRIHQQHHHQNHNNHNTNNNPFGCNKCLKAKVKNQRKILVLAPETHGSKQQKASSSKQQQQHVIKNENTEIEQRSNGSDNSKLMMAVINEKMAKLWNETGYRGGTGAGNRITQCDSQIDNRKDSSSILPSTTSNNSQQKQSCARQAMSMDYPTSSSNENAGTQNTPSSGGGWDDSSSTVVELAAYLEETLFIPKKMSFMAEMMYT